MMTNKHALTNTLIHSVNTLQNNAGEINRRKTGIYRNEGLPINARVNGLIKAAKCRTVIFNKDKENPDNQCLLGFIEYLREHNKRFVNLIFYLANIDNKKHHLKFNEFNKQEKQAIINALFQLQVLVALIPKDIAPL
ncbi:DUF5347 family protein [Arsenophonus nasoniae]|uniref:DUF5347 family protein n=1 Tax=Arsenophonus nasoniae TaxID=638 RepID=UPI003879E3FC